MSARQTTGHFGTENPSLETQLTTCNRKMKTKSEIGGPKQGRGSVLYTESPESNYLEPLYFVTAFVPSDTACFANSPGNNSRTAVCTSRLEIVDFLL